MTEQTIHLCSECLKVLPVSSFSWIKENNQYRSKCKKCVREYKKEYNIINSEILKQKAKKYNKQNSDKQKEYQKEYNIKNAKKVKKSRKEYYLKNVKVLKAKRRRYAKNNKEKRKIYEKANHIEIKEKKREWRLKNIIHVRKLKNKNIKERRKVDVQFDLKQRLISRIHSTLRERNITKSTKSIKLLGCTFQFYKKYVESLFTEGMSWENRNLWEIDHIKALGLFDLTKVEEQKIAFNFTNTIPLWKEDHIKKTTQDILLIKEYQKEQLTPIST